MIQKFEQIWQSLGLEDREDFAEQVFDFLSKKGYASPKAIEVGMLKARLRRYELKYGELIPTERALDTVSKVSELRDLFEQYAIEDNYESHEDVYRS
jgi:hypothetical protein